MATCRNPGSSPARKRSSTFSSKRRMRSISRRKSFKRSPPATCSLSSTLATRGQRTDTQLHSRAVKLGEQWREIEGGLPEDWSSIQVSLSTAEDEHADRAALILAPFAPGRTGSRFRFAVRRDQDPGRVLRRLDQEEIRGLVELVGSETAAPAPP